MKTHPIEYIDIPRATFCTPNVASFGLTEQQARDAGMDVVVGKVQYGAVGAGTVYGDRTGVIKIIGDKKYGELVGGHIVGAKATELIQELVNAKALEGGYAEVARIVHGHPTLSEGVMEAARAADGWLIHGMSQPRFYYDLASPECYLVAERALHAVGEVPEWIPVSFGSPAFRCAEEVASYQEDVERRAAALGADAAALAGAVPGADITWATLAATYAKWIGRGVAFSLAALRQAFAAGRDLSRAATTCCSPPPRARCTRTP